jgi:hypothetical protein
MSRCHEVYHPDATEEMIQNYSDENTTDSYGTVLPGWRRFRIEYGFECSCPEGTVYIKDGPDIYDRLDKILELIGDPVQYVTLLEDGS